MKTFLTLVLLGGLAVAGDKPSAADRVVLLQEQVEGLQAENAKLRAVLQIAERQVQILQARRMGEIAKKSGCESLDESFNCTTGPVQESPKPTPKEK